MSKYIGTFNHENKSLSVALYIENQPVFGIGESLHQINELAYMNGYNWEALLKFYFEREHAELWQGMKTDPEAGMFVVYCEYSPENEVKMAKIEEKVVALIDAPDSLEQLVRDHGDEIEWD